MAELNKVAILPHRPGATAAASELCFVSDDPESAFDTAVAAGATALHPVEQKPWGQRVGHLLDCNGCLVEVCSPVP